MAMDLAKPGDVIVIDAGGELSVSIFGELMVTYCRKLWHSWYCDESIRDAGAMECLTDFGICPGVTPDGPIKWAREVNTPVVCGGGPYIQAILFWEMRTVSIHPSLLRQRSCWKQVEAYSQKTGQRI